MKKTLEKMSEDAYLNDVFKKLYFKELSSGDEFVVSMWIRISASIKHMLQTIGLKDCTPVGAESVDESQLKRSEILRLEEIVNVTLPQLRRETKPLRKGDDQKEEKDKEE